MTFCIAAISRQISETGNHKIYRKLIKSLIVLQRFSDKNIY